MAEKRTRRPPATTPEGRNAQLASMAYDLAEKQLKSGEASAQVITHFLKAESQREKIELELIGQRTSLIKAQEEALASAARVEELMVAAIEAFKTYAPGNEANELPNDHG